MPVALVTGASRGLGKAIADRLERDGFNVLAPPSGRLDVTKPKEITHYVAGCPGIDVLVNNAGIFGPIGLLEDCDPSDWLMPIQANLIGPMALCRAVLPYMRSKDAGKIINIAGGGATGPLPRCSAYAASKAALVRLTECLAAEYPTLGINAVLPGPLPTDMMDEILSAGAEKLGEEAYAAQMKAKTGAVGALERAADLVSYLASSQSDGLSGKTISARYDKWPFTDIPELMASNQLTLRRIDGASN